MQKIDIKYAVLGKNRKAKVTRALALTLGAYALGATGNVPILDEPTMPTVRMVSDVIPLPSLSQQVAQLSTESAHFIQAETMARGDTLATVFNRLGVYDHEALAFIKKDKVAKQLMGLDPGQEIIVQKTEQGELVSLRAPLKGSPGAYLSLEKEGDVFEVNKQAATPERRMEMQSVVIEKSLFAATDTANVPDSITSQMIDMFSTRIDFSDLSRGDQFNVVYETFWQDGALVRTGRILAAQFVHEGKSHQTLWFEDPLNKSLSGYYGFDGSPLKKAFLKSPVSFSRVSSGFAMRNHPIAGDWRKHNGVDFSAPQGTPIRAAGDGIAEFVGKQSGYGNVIKLKHLSSYTTVYAHLSRFSSTVRPGARVSQGDVIGYVGATGWATGPHLHYEFHINNKPQNPLTVDVTYATALTGLSLRTFKAVASDMQHRFAVLAPVAFEHRLAAR